jgi:hypothetical protein
MPVGHDLPVAEANHAVLQVRPAVLDPVRGGGVFDGHDLIELVILEAGDVGFGVSLSRSRAAEVANQKAPEVPHVVGVHLYGVPNVHAGGMIRPPARFQNSLEREAGRRHRGPKISEIRTLGGAQQLESCVQTEMRWSIYEGHPARAQAACGARARCVA